MFVSTTGYISEFQLEDYLNYAHKNKEIEIVNLGSKKLYQLYLENTAKSNRAALVTNHKSTIDILLKSYGQERLVNVNGKQVRRLVLDIEQVNYKELQDQLLGDFVFIHKATKQLVIVDNTSYDEEIPNNISSKYIQKKLLKLKRRCHFYKTIAKEVVGKGSYYLSIVWNSNTEQDLLEFIEQSHLENKHLRSQFTIAKAANELSDISKILTRIHVKTNIDLTKLSFDVTERIY